MMSVKMMVKIVGLPLDWRIQPSCIDAEVLDFFRHTGKRYQSRMNAVLRAYMEAHKTPETSK